MSLKDKIVSWFHMVILQHNQKYGREHVLPSGWLQWDSIQCDCGKEWLL